jgi:tRNA (5-methylaminomethyl-2-thiouridylate)-methyltransferase
MLPTPALHAPGRQLVSLRSFAAAPPLPRRLPRCQAAGEQLVDAAPAPALEQLADARVLRWEAPPAALSASGAPPPEEWPDHPALLAGCEPGAAPLRVAVLLSGGVDSSLALRLVAAAGHAPVAFYLQIWFEEDFRNSWDACPWEEDLAFCRAVCAAAGVPLRVVPLTREYWDRVVAHSLAEIRAGRTPNPDVLCNSRVKFGAFFEHLTELERKGGEPFDRVASGHYARLERAPPGGPPPRLALTPDAVKDQTYFLAHLAPPQLARLLFPLGALTKAQVRALAAAAALPTAARADSQGICFLGRVRFDEFVRAHLGEWPGPLLEEESGAVVGYHRGFWFHTVGQRRGIRLAGGPWYVTRKDPDANAVYVSRRYAERAAGDAARAGFRCSAFSWTGDLRPAPGAPLRVKVRHGPLAYAARLELDAGGGGGAAVRLDGADQGLAAGQYAVFYQGGYCLGCAVIDGPLEEEAHAVEAVEP